MNIQDRTREILEAHGLDFTILKLPLTATDENSEILLTPYYGLFNSKTRECINTAKDGYTVSQNAEVVEMALAGIEKFGDKLSVSKAGSINGGRRVFIQLKVEGIQKIGDDTMNQFITIIDSNDGSTGLSVGIGDEQAHCFNQFFKFYKAGNSRFRHTATITERIKEIPSLIETALSENLKQVEIYKKMLAVELKGNDTDRMVKEVLKYDNFFTAPDKMAKMTKRSEDMMNTLYSNIATEVAYSGNNVFSLFQGVTRFTTHHQVAPKRTGGKMETLIVGAGYDKAIKGYNLAVKLAA